MDSFLFYDPGELHQQSVIDPDILSVQQLDVLNQRIAANNDIQRVVCICCANKSDIIQAIQHHQHIKLIYLCKQHHGPEQNPLYDQKVQDDIEFAPQSEWEFKIRCSLSQVCLMGGHHHQAHLELQRLIEIKKRTLSQTQSGGQATS